MRRAASETDCAISEREPIDDAHRRHGVAALRSNDPPGTAREKAQGGEGVSQLKPAISPARKPALTESSTISLLRSGFRVVEANTRRSSICCSWSILACLPSMITTCPCLSRSLFRLSQVRKRFSASCVLMRSATFLEQFGSRATDRQWTAYLLGGRLRCARRGECCSTAAP
jgi:hypothetical protein